MSAVHLIYLSTGSLVTLFWALFGVTAVREKRPRAATLGSLTCLGFTLIWIAFYLADPAAVWFWLATTAVWLFIALCFLPLGGTKAIEMGSLTEQVDERDIMFSREEYLPGSKRYEAYYDRRPELKAVDDRIRSLPELLEPGGKLYDPVRSLHTASIFQVIEGLLSEVDGPINPGRIVVSDTVPPGSGADTAVPTPAAMTSRIKEMALHLGAAEVGVAPLDPAFVYSHVGRGPEPWGAPIRNRHRFAIAFTLEMDYDHVEQAPGIGITEESAREYLQGALISIALAQLIRQLGYPARAHIAGSNYQIMLPPVAHAAGLGELGRFGYLISRKFGARVRLGAVTTDLPLVTDSPVVFGVQDFCEKCQRCATSCPSGSIPRGPRKEVRGVRKWPLVVESCLHYWRYLGTDCGLCMKVCPYSHPPALVHELVRRGISQSSFARFAAVFGEDLFYGRSVAYPLPRNSYQSS